jgi:hypothetical protein
MNELHQFWSFARKTARMALLVVTLGHKMDVQFTMGPVMARYLQVQSRFGSSMRYKELAYASSQQP